MTIDDLLQRLTEYRETHGGETEVRLMIQQHWPFEYEIAGLASGPEIEDMGDDEDESPEYSLDAPIVFIVEGGQLEYGSKRAWEIAY